MAKLVDNITNILAAVGVKLTTEQSAVLAELPQDEVSATVQTLFDTATNQATSELAKIAQKAGNLDKFDESLASWSDILGDDIKAIAKEKGIPKLEKIKTLIASNIEKAKAAAANGDNVDVVKLREKIVELEQQGAKLIADKETEINSVKSDSINQIFTYKMLTKLQGRKDILDSYKSEKALSKLVFPEIMDYLKEKGLEIRPEQLDVVKSDTQTPYLKGGKNATVDEIIEEAITEKGYRQNAGETPPNGIVSVDSSGNTPKVTVKSFLKPDLIES